VADASVFGRRQERDDPETGIGGKRRRVGWDCKEGRLLAGAEVDR